MGASIAAAAAVCVAAGLAVGVAGVGAAAAEAQRVSGVADAAALAAADAAAGYATGEPCERAARVAAAQGAVVASCGLEGMTVTVVAEGAFGRFPVRAAARAGPPPS
ncbi:helicase [Microbacterium excoecariae]|uniref:helicase n=1 Tax=Microbacterium excoecariae TaxID=2715210 RepID=UPI00140A6AEF|nr:helicase [Microbacterium excoecariae]NHI17557.1 helicase [Microbacterium excoecariae]